MRGLLFWVRALSLLWVVPGLGLAYAQNPPPLLPEVEAFLEQAKQQKLAETDQWRRLLYVPEGGSKSQINSPDFFLSGERNATPEQELQATLRAFFEPLKPGQVDLHPRCVFPARYLWLNQRLGLDRAAPALPECPKFRKWARPQEIRSLSLILVSGYLGNPASSFGHTLLRLNSTDGSVASRLTDTGLNFGALIPPRVGTIEYVVKGIFGGFQAGFSDSPYYEQDVVYTRTEFRDSWEYELQLSPWQIQLLVAHLWEVIGKKFDYYFLSENCAYRMMELLEVVTGDDLTYSAKVWFLPVEAVYRLRDADQLRRARLMPELLRPPRFIPSAERELHAELEQLTPAQREVFDRLISLRGQALESSLRELGPQGKAPILNAMLSYFQYVIRGQPYEEKENTPAHLARDQVLRARLSLPTQALSLRPLDPLPSPERNARPMRATVGLGQKAGRPVAWLGWTAYHQPILSPGRSEPGELVVADLALVAQRGTASRALELDHLDFIRVAKLQTRHFGLEGEDRASWRVALGVESANHARAVSAHAGTRAAPYRLRARGAYGYAQGYPAASMVTYAMLESELRTSADRVAVRPHLGLLWRSDALVASLELGSQWESMDRRWHRRVAAELTGRVREDLTAGLTLQAGSPLRVNAFVSAHW